MRESEPRAQIFWSQPWFLLTLLSLLKGRYNTLLVELAFIEIGLSFVASLWIS